MEKDEQLRQLFAEKLGPVNEQLRQKKKQAFSRACTVGLACLLLTIAAAVYISLDGDDEDLPILIAFMGGFITLIGWFITFFFTLNERNRIFKEQVVSRIVQFLDPDLNYDADDYIPEHIYEESCIFPQSVDRYGGGDLVSGSYQNIPMRFSKLHTEYETESSDSDGNSHTSYHTIFYGIFFEADFNKDFHGITLVVPDLAERFLGQTLGRFFQKMNISRPGKLIRMENVEFEKIFAVYSTDDQEARYILTPKLMERILGLNRRLGDSCLSLSFCNSHVYLAIPLRKEMFEYHGGDVTFESICRVRDEITAFLDIVREMD